MFNKMEAIIITRKNYERGCIIYLGGSRTFFQRDYEGWGREKVCTSYEHVLPHTW